MRWKIILVNGGIVLIISLVTFFLLRTSLGNAVADPRAQRGDLLQAINGAEAKLTLDALLAERWLDRQAASDEIQEVFSAGTKRARADAATSQANRLRDIAVGAKEFVRKTPSLVLFVDADGVGMGRNGSELMRGDDLASVYPDLAASLKTKTTGSGLWVSEKRQEQLVASYAPVFSDTGELLGALVLGSAINDERLAQVSEMTSGAGLALVVGGRTIAQGGAKDADFRSEAVRAAVDAAGAGKTSFVPQPQNGAFFAASPLAAFEGAVLVGAVPTAAVASINSLLWPVFAVALLGLFLVVTGGFLLGNYLSRPIAEIEEGLLLAINGQQDLRFDLDHDELGGLTSRINGLLNALLGVPEDQSQE